MPIEGRQLDIGYGQAGDVDLGGTSIGFGVKARESGGQATERDDVVRIEPGVLVVRNRGALMHIIEADG